MDVFGYRITSVAPRTDDLYDLFPLHDVDISRQICSRYCIVNLARVPGRDPCNLHDLAHVPGLALCYADPAQPLTTWQVRN